MPCVFSFTVTSHHTVWIYFSHRTSSSLPADQVCTQLINFTDTTDRLSNINLHLTSNTSIWSFELRVLVFFWQVQNPPQMRYLQMNSEGFCRNDFSRVTWLLHQLSICLVLEKWCRGTNRMLGFQPETLTWFISLFGWMEKYYKIKIKWLWQWNQHDYPSYLKLVLLHSASHLRLTS